MRDVPLRLDPTEIDAHVPRPRSERGAWAAALALGVVGLTVFALALSGVLGGAPAAIGPPPVVAVTPTPAPAAGTSPAHGDTSGQASERMGAGVASGSPAARRGEAAGGAAGGVGASGGGAGGNRALAGASGAGAQGGREAAVYEGATSVYIPESWMTGFYPIYAIAQRTFGVNWLLIASIHRQESAFSTAPGIYKGLNFAGCCGGPMQFNVINGPGRGSGSTWSLVSDSYRYGPRPVTYDHMTVTHPSIYDDFDAIMAAAHLLSADGAGYGLDAGAWGAAYDYYGHDAAGVVYADQVLARAIYWSQHGFCANCGTPQPMIDAVHAAYGAPVAASLEAQAAAAARARPRRRYRH